MLLSKSAINTFMNLNTKGLQQGTEPLVSFKSRKVRLE